MPANDPRTLGATDETISQSEVERLLAQLGTGESVEGSGLETANLRPSIENALLQRHDFGQFSFFSAGELRKLRVRQEAFIRSLAARAAMHLRTEVGMQMFKLETMPYQKLIDGLSSPTHLVLVRVPPLQGICLLDIPLPLGLAVVDRELGGPGTCTEDPRELSPMEGRVLAQFLEIIVAEWCGSWRDLLDLAPVLLQSESSPRFVQTSPPDHTMLVLGIEVRCAGMVEQIQFAFPHECLEPLILKLNTGADSAARPKAARAAAVPRWNPALASVTVRLTAELPHLEITARELAALKVGDVLNLPTNLSNQVLVCLEKAPKFVGSLGEAGKRRAVKIDRLR